MSFLVGIYCIRYLVCSMQTVPSAIAEKLALRAQLRKKGEYAKADQLRQEVTDLGYVVEDTADGTSRIVEKSSEQTRAEGIGKCIVFGSGELASTGLAIHEQAIKQLHAPVKIALLETPAGYENNPHNWYTKLKNALEKGLVNYRPEISLVAALRKDGSCSTNSTQLLAPLETADYIHTGAGSPSYAVNHLKDSLALSLIKAKLLEGVSVSIASAAAAAFGKYTLPVYELYFAGHDPYWMDGLDFFAEFGLPLSFIPHWNNTDGGKDIDTRYSYMGEPRFNQLLSLLPKDTLLVGIDEHTALVFDFNQQTATVLGKGAIHVLAQGKEQIFDHGMTVEFAVLKSSS